MVLLSLKLINALNVFKKITKIRALVSITPPDLGMGSLTRNMKHYIGSWHLYVAVLTFIH